MPNSRHSSAICSPSSSLAMNFSRSSIGLHTFQGILRSPQKAQLCNPCLRNEMSPLSQEGQASKIRCLSNLPDFHSDRAASSKVEKGRLDFEEMNNAGSRVARRARNTFPQWSLCAFPRQRLQHQDAPLRAQVMLTHTTAKEQSGPVGCHPRGSNVGALLRSHS